jgi:Arc/MetJ-type ribon-helix-helix transcriptional regulator
MIDRHTKEAAMSSIKVAITLDSETLRRVDELVSERVFPSRSRAVQVAVAEKLARMEQTRLAEQCARLDPAFEQQLAEEGLGEEMDSWPAW